VKNRKSNEVIKKKQQYLVSRWMGQILYIKIGMYFAPEMRV
jgi:hypothetical protein